MKYKKHAVRKPLWRRIVTIVGIVILVPVVVVASLVGYGMITSDGPSIGHWTTDDKRKQYAATYEQALKVLPEPSEQSNVPTDFGTVRVYKWSNDAVKDKTPIVLLPGRTSGAPMWYANLSYLMTEHPVYAFDAIGDAGMSVQTKAIATNADQALYLEQTFDYLHLSKVNIVGHSFGSYNAANYATRYPERVASLSLIEPVFVLKGIKPSLMLKLTIATLPGAPKSWLESGITDITGATSYNPGDPTQRAVKEGGDYYKSSLPMAETITTEQAARWSMPVYIGMADNSTKLHDAVAIVKLAKQHIPSVETKIWPNSTHSLPMEYPEAVSEAILSNVNRAK